MPFGKRLGSACRRLSGPRSRDIQQSSTATMSYPASRKPPATSMSAIRRYNRSLRARVTGICKWDRSHINAINGFEILTGQSNVKIRPGVEMESREMLAAEHPAIISPCWPMSMTGSTESGVMAWKLWPNANENVKKLASTFWWRYLAIFHVLWGRGAGLLYQRSVIESPCDLLEIHFSVELRSCDKRYCFRPATQLMTILSMTSDNNHRDASLVCHAVW